MCVCCPSVSYLVIAVASNTRNWPAHRTEAVPPAAAATQHNWRVPLGLLRAAQRRPAAFAPEVCRAPARVPARWTRLRAPDASALVSGAREPEPQRLAARVASAPLRAPFRTDRHRVPRHLRLRNRIGIRPFGERLGGRQNEYRFFWESTRVHASAASRINCGPFD